MPRCVAEEADASGSHVGAGVELPCVDGRLLPGIPAHDGKRGLLAARVSSSPGERHPDPGQALSPGMP